MVCLAPIWFAVTSTGYFLCGVTPMGATIPYFRSLSGLPLAASGLIPFTPPLLSAFRILDGRPDEMGRSQSEASELSLTDQESGDSAWITAYPYKCRMTRSVRAERSVGGD